MARRYNPETHHRRSTRLDAWDYRSPAAYFVTICTHERALLFEEPPFRAIAETVWQSIPMHTSRQHVQLDAWVVMPNHVHGILILVDQTSVRAGQPGELPGPGASPPIPVASPGTPSDPPDHPLPIPVAMPASPGLNNVAIGSLGAIVGFYKSQVARRINSLRRTPASPVWQRGFHEHIIRTVDELDRTRVYIRDNPARWAEGRDKMDAW